MEVCMPTQFLIFRQAQVLDPLMARIMPINTGNVTGAQLPRSCQS
jgi:hypothetical protein